MMGTFNFTEDQAITFITIAVDFGISECGGSGDRGVLAVHDCLPACCCCCYCCCCCQS